MKQAIITKYLSPTNTKGARVKAYATGARPTVTIPWNHDWTPGRNHYFAAELLKKRLAWSGTLESGSLSPGQVVHVFID